MTLNPSTVDRSSWLSSVPAITPPTTSTRLMSAVSPLSLARPTTTSRGERLANSLRRGYISARVLHTRAGPSALTEFLGPVAPERYLSLPRKSSAAAKALTAVALKKGLKEVTRLETFRRYGTVREGARTVREDEDDGDVGWFDGVAAALLGERIGGGVDDMLDAAKALRLGANADATPRTAHLPLETFRVEMTGGIDFSHSIAPATYALRVAEQVADNVPPDVIMETEPLPVTLEGSGQREGVSQPVVERAKPSVSDVIEEALPDVVEVEAVQSMTQNPVNDASAEATLMPTKSVFDEIFDDVSAPLSVNPALELPSDVAQSTPAAPKNSNQKTLTNGSSKTSAAPPNDASQPGVSSASGAFEVRPVLFALDGSPRIRFDIDIVDSKPKALQAQNFTTPAEPVVQASNGPAIKIQKEPQMQAFAAVAEKPIPNDQNAAKAGGTSSMPPVHSRPEAAGASNVACNVRQDAPTTMLQEMLEDLNHGSVPTSTVKSEVPRDNASGEVVNIDADDENEQVPSQQPASKLKRARKRKMSATGFQGKHVIEERRDRMRTAVVATLQEDPDMKKTKSVRSSMPSANGSRPVCSPDHFVKSKQFVQEPRLYPKRSSRRLRKQSTPIIDSSESDENILDADDDFVLQEGRESNEPPYHSTNSRAARHPIPHVPMAENNGSPSATERKERSGEVRKTEQVPVKEETPVSKIKPKPKPSPIAKERKKKSWEEEISRLERLADCSESGSPNLSSTEEDSELESYGGLPLVDRLVNWHLRNGRCLLDNEPFDEHGEMMQFYKETRNEPPYEPIGGGSPGTAFVLECWRRNVGASGALNSEKLKEEQEEGGKPDSEVVAIERGRADASRTSTRSKESSDGSSERSDSSGGVDVGDESETRRMRLKAKAKAMRARELQTRVCGDLLPSMEPEAKRRVLRWAEKDFTWFNDGADMMEIVGSKSLKPCSQCNSVAGNSDYPGCEESILLKLWTNMTWRKVRRMRHRVRNVIPS